MRKVFCTQVFAGLALFPFCVKNYYFDNAHVLVALKLAH